MKADQLKELYDAQPFVPFEIVLTNGATVQVAHPEFMAFSPDYRTVIAHDIRGGGGKRIDVKLIIALNELPRPISRRKGRKK